MTLTRTAVLLAHLVTCYWCSSYSSDDFTGPGNGPNILVTCYWCSCCSSDDFTCHILDNKFGLLLFIIIYNNRPNAVVAKMISGILVASMAGTCETTGPEFGCTQQVQKVIMEDNLEKMSKQTKNNSNFTFSTERVHSKRSVE